MYIFFSIQHWLPNSATFTDFRAFFPFVFTNFRHFGLSQNLQKIRQWNGILNRGSFWVMDCSFHLCIFQSKNESIFPISNFPVNRPPRVHVFDGTDKTVPKTLKDNTVIDQIEEINDGENLQLSSKAESFPSLLYVKSREMQYSSSQ